MIWVLIFKVKRFWVNQKVTSKYFFLNKESFVYTIDNTHKNVTLNNQSLCGVGYCRQDSITTVNNDVEESSVNMLLVIYLVFGIAAMISTFTFLDGIKQSKTNEPTALAKFWSTCNLFRKRKMCCLIPLATFYGLQQAFAYGDFTSVSAFLLISYHIFVQI